MNDILKRLDEIDGPKADEIARIRRRLRAQQPRLADIFVPTGLAMAAAAALLLGALPSADAFPEPAAPVEASLTEAGSLALTGDVRLEIQGMGAVSGTEDEIDIDWRLGTLAVAVTPEQGIDLTVRTEDAAVSVVGTVFSVERTALGTRVTVERGAVAVECRDMTRHALTGGGSVECLPESSLGRLQAMKKMGAPPEDLLAEIRRGLGQAPDKSTEGELLANQIRVHLQQGDRAQAAAVAWRYLNRGHTTRAAEFSSLAREARK